MQSVGAFGQAMRMPEGPRRTAAVAAWIQGLYPTRPPILVGGAAVELYTGGAYTTGDFDFVGDVPAAVARSLEEAGFAREGRHWIHREGEIFIEFPGSSVAEHERVAMLEVGDVSVLTLSPEDMIIDRLAAWQFWKSTTDGASAFLIWRAQQKTLDPKRLAALAEIKGVGKGLARLRDFVRNVGGRGAGDMGKTGTVKRYISPARAMLSELPGGLVRRRPRRFAEWKALRGWGKLPTWEIEPVGYLMRLARENADLTQIELARRLGCSQQAVAQAERWESNPTVEFIRKWADACGSKAVIRLESPN